MAFLLHLHSTQILHHFHRIQEILLMSRKDIGLLSFALFSSSNKQSICRHYIDYVLSAKEQGIATYGAGDEEKEAARIEIISQLNFTQLPNPTKTFTVYAPIKWNPSDFAIQTGETYNITVFGSQYWYDGGIRVNSQGYSSYFDSISNCYVGMGRCRPHLKRSRRLASANWMSLGNY